VPRQRRLELAAKEEIDPGQQDRRHTGCEGNTPTVDDGLRLGLAQIERGEYFEAHESLEDVWRAAESAEKDFFQGLVHVAVAWYQAGRGNRVGCERQLEKAVRRLTPYAPDHRGVGVAYLLQSVEQARRTVAEGSLALEPPFLATIAKPYGCSVIVWRPGESGREYLILHRRTARGPTHEGDWAWTPPSGARAPGEDADATAKRELHEETGLELPLTRSDVGDEGWRVYTAQAPQDVEVTLSEEHDRFRWVSAEEAERLCLPAMVARSIRAVDARLRSERP
jgi:8-oxo-dGTP pyrophosphatase MutT (NUDIX family)